jgi:Arc/MetJ-type ribon-helix-helix transcriptional regulator
MGQKNTGVYVGSKIPKALRLSVERAVQVGPYLNVSDFVRSAIKDKLLAEGYFITVGSG